MSFISELFVKAFLSRQYICPECGKTMEFEDENESSLVCPHCGYSIDIDDYGSVSYDELYPTKEDLDDSDLELGEEREVYDEVHDELHGD